MGLIRRTDRIPAFRQYPRDQRPAYIDPHQPIETQVHPWCESAVAVLNAVLGGLAVATPGFSHSLGSKQTSKNFKPRCDLRSSQLE
jgi:hypothetical protein